MRCSTVPAAAARLLHSSLRYASPQRKPSVSDRALNCLAGTRSDATGPLTGVCIMLLSLYPSVARFRALLFCLSLRWEPYVHRDLASSV